MYKSHSNTDERTVFCSSCRNTNQAARHRHFLAFDGELEKHLQENGLSADDAHQVSLWAHTMRGQYGGRVDEHGIPLSAFETRRLMHVEYAKTYTAPAGPLGIEPRTEKGRKIAFSAFRYLAGNARTERASATIAILDEHFPAVASEEATWGDFVRFCDEYRTGELEQDGVGAVDIRPVAYALQR